MTRFIAAFAVAVLGVAAIALPASADDKGFDSPSTVTPSSHVVTQLGAGETALP